MIDFIKKNKVLALLIFSIFVGSGFSYGKIYLLHIVVPIVIIYKLIQAQKLISKFFNRFYFPIYLFYLLVVISSLINGLNLHWLAFYILSFLIYVSIVLFTDEIKSDFNRIVQYILALVSVDLIIGSLEVVSSFRYPISRYSRLNHYFKRSDFLVDQPECTDVNYLLSSPTGFHWNPNDFSLVLLLAGLFTSFIKNTFFKWSIRILMFSLILSAGARLGVYLMTLYLITSIVLEIRESKIWIITVLTFISFIYTDGFYVFPTGSKKVKEIALISNSEFPSRFPEHCGDDEKIKSEGMRKDLLYRGLEKITESPIIGGGAGSFSNYLEEEKRRGSLSHGITSSHNFIVELLVDFGVLIFIPFYWLLYMVFKRSNQLNDKHSILLIMFTFSMPVFMVMSSSLVYFPPFYLILFITIIYTVNKLSGFKFIPDSKAY